MEKTDFQEIRQRWEDGTMSVDEWTKAIEDHLVRDKEKAGEVSTVPTEWETTYTFPINERIVTEDLIRRFANSIGDFNPLYHDPAYGAKTLLGSMIAPPTFNNAIVSAGSFPDKPQIPGWNSFYGGTEHRYSKVIRPGDTFRVINKYLGTTEKTTPGKPYRLFTPRNQRTLINQRDEVVVTVIANEISMATPPGAKKAVAKSLYADRVRRRYTKEELDMIHHAYKEEWEGKNRQGAKVLYWEDVAEGAELSPLLRGPLDVSDIVAYVGVGGTGALAFGVKWKALRSDLGRGLIDPETGEHHNAIDWHYVDSMAQVMGLPYAQSTGRQNEGIIGTLISNWMGDDGFVKRLHIEHRGIWFQGETVRVKGKVAKKYIENGEHLVDVEAWSELFDKPAIRCTVASATVKLISKAE